MDSPLLARLAAEFAMPLRWRGDLALLERPRRTLLISRTERLPDPRSTWVRGTITAVEKLCAAGEVLVTGCGRLPFDLALWSCRQTPNSAAVVVLTAPPDAADKVDDVTLGELLPPTHLLIWPECAEAPEGTAWRDHLMGYLAEKAYAIAVRPSGNMAAVAEEFRERGGTVETLYIPEFDQICAGVELDEPEPPPTVNWGEYLIHFTREPNEPWPGETYPEFLRWLAHPESRPRDAFSTLERILQERRLRASGALIPGHVPMVCFTAKTPAEVAELRRWRRGLRRWNFTPYGLAIRRAALERAGAQPVVYKSSLREAAVAVDPAFTQPASSGAGAWREEGEWRVRGDVDLGSFAPDDLLVLVRRQWQAAFVEREFGLRTWLNVRREE